MTSLLNYATDVIQEQDDEIIEITGERDAYKELYEESKDEIKKLNHVIDEYEEKKIDSSIIDKLKTMTDNNYKFSEIRNRKIEQIKNKKLEFERSRQNYKKRFSK